MDGPTQDKPKIKVCHWFDIACPFCYIGDKRFNEVCEELNIKDRIDMEMKAFQLNKDAPKKQTLKMEEIFAKKNGISIEGARDRIDRISNIGKDEGLDIKFATVQFTNTFDAHRLVKYIKSQGKDYNRFIELLYIAYFTDNLNVADRNLLIEAAEKVGIDKKDSTKLLKGKEFGDEVRKDIAEASDKGITIIPHYIVNGKYPISGSDKSGIKFTFKQVLNDEELQKTA